MLNLRADPVLSGDWKSAWLRGKASRVVVLTWILVLACMTLGTITDGDGMVASQVPSIPL